MKKKKYTLEQQYYRDLFNALMDIAMKDKRIPEKLLKSWDKVANYLGDIAKGRNPK